MRAKFRITKTVQTMIILSHYGAIFRRSEGQSIDFSESFRGIPFGGLQRTSKSTAAMDFCEEKQKLRAGLTLRLRKILIRKLSIQ